MNRCRLGRLAFLAVVAVLVPARATLAGPTYRLRDTVVLEVRKRVDTPEMCWPSAWHGQGLEGKALLKARELGGMKLRQYMLEHDGDYLSFGVAVKSGSQWLIDEGTRLVLVYEDARVTSLELLTTDSQLEMEVYSNTQGPIVLDPEENSYFRANDGRFLVVARFPEGSLGPRLDEPPTPQGLLVQHGSDELQACELASAPQFHHQPGGDP